MTPARAGLDPVPSAQAAQPQGGALSLAGWIQGPGGARPREVRVWLGSSGDLAILAGRPADHPGAWRWRVTVACPPKQAGMFSVRMDIDGCELDLGQVAVEDTAVELETELPAATQIAICMATYNPDAPLLRRQLESLQAQDRSDWVCLIQDDASSPETRAVLEEIAAQDARFRLRGNPENLGFYRNFEAAIARVPQEVPWIALADQDDVWHAHKLTKLIAPLEAGATLAYSDCRVVDRDGEVLSPTFWTGKRNQWTDFEALVQRNTVTGAAAAFRRDLLEKALPFPRLDGVKIYHDHWLAVAASSAGELAYVDEPLYDYVQHEGADTGHFSKRKRPGTSSALARGLRLRGLIEAEDRIRELFLMTLRSRQSMTARQDGLAAGLVGLGRSPAAHLGWLLGRVLSGHLRTPGWKLFLRRLEAGLRGA